MVGREAKKKQCLTLCDESSKNDGSSGVLEMFYILARLVVTWVFVYTKKKKIIEFYTSEVGALLNVL